MENIDLVVLYVDSTDKHWQELYTRYAPLSNDSQITGKQRFRRNPHFKYWFRGVENYVSWIKTIYLVVQSHSQVPDWIDTNKVKVVLHEDFMPKECLPVFNSQAIEMFLWNISGLSEKFLYSNDDTYFVGDLKPEDFFENGKVKTSFHKASLGDMTNVPLWKQSILNSGILANNEEQQDLMKQGSYITPSHTIRPYLKSMMLELFTQKQQEILSSISKFRAENNFTVYMYDFYLKYKRLTIKKNYSAVYHSSKASVGLIANTLINPDVYKIVCINDTSEEENLEKEEKLTKQFKICFPNKSKYEVLN